MIKNKNMAEHPTKFTLQEAIDFLLKSFKVERYIYLGITILSIIFLAFQIIILFDKQEYTNILAMFGPTGLMTFAFSRVLKMWSDCIDLVKTYISHQR
jgi:hypothetical protein